MTCRSMPSLEFLEDHFEIDLKEKSFLKARKPKIGIYWAGRYWIVCFGGLTYAAHRIIYCLFNKTLDIDNLVIDHIDSCSSNNNPSNLQAITQKENIKKRTKNIKILRSHNTSKINLGSGNKSREREKRKGRENKIQERLRRENGETERNC
jgi:hypothetical protein